MPEARCTLDRDKLGRHQTIAHRKFDGVINQPASDPEALACGGNCQIVDEQNFSGSDLLERCAQRRRCTALPAVRQQIACQLTIRTRSEAIGHCSIKTAGE